jgi:hypothetical protein
MKYKPDWIAVGAALSIACLMHLMLTSDRLIFPAFLGALVLQLVVSRRSERPS